MCCYSVDLKLICFLVSDPGERYSCCANILNLRQHLWHMLAASLRRRQSQTRRLRNGQNLLAKAFCNSKRAKIHRRTGLMLSRGAVETLPKFLWRIVFIIVMKLPEFNIFCDKSARIFLIFPSICPNFHGFPKKFGGGAVAPTAPPLSRTPMRKSKQEYSIIIEYDSSQYQRNQIMFLWPFVLVQLSAASFTRDSARHYCFWQPLFLVFFVFSYVYGPKRTATQLLFFFEKFPLKVWQLWILFCLSFQTCWDFKARCYFVPFWSNFGAKL